MMDAVFWEFSADTAKYAVEICHGLPADGQLRRHG